MLSVYLSNRYVRAAEGDMSGGKMSVRGLYEAVDNSGCILNGTVMDAESFTAFIGTFWETYKLPKKGIRLVLDSNQFTSKVTDVPVLKPRQTNQFISREFTDVGRINDPVYGSFPVREAGNKSKVRSMFAMMAPRDFIQGYQEIFASLGITIDCIENGMGVMLRLTEQLKQIKSHKEACIVQYVDDITLFNALVVNGNFVYYNKNRLFSDAGTMSFFNEISNAASSILQFAKAQNIPEKIDRIYIAGVPREQLSMYEGTVLQMNADISVEPLTLEREMSVTASTVDIQNISKYALAIGGLIRTPEKLGIMSQMAQDPKKAGARSKKMKVILPVGILAGIMIAVTAAVVGRLVFLNMALSDVQAYNTRFDVVEACAEYDSLSNEIRALQTLSGSLDSFKGAVLEYPIIDSHTEQVVSSCAAGLVSAKISSYDSSSGVLTFDTSADNVELINQFIALMSQQDIFASVDYTGYVQDSAGQWNVKVNCRMAGREALYDE